MKKVYKYGSYRYPKTAQEKRLACDKETRQYIRGKRRLKGLPCSYDDIPIKSKGKSWKHRRKTKYHNEEKKPKKFIKEFITYYKDSGIRPAFYYIRDKDIYNKVKAFYKILEKQNIYFEYEYIRDEHGYIIGTRYIYWNHVEI